MAAAKKTLAIDPKVGDELFIPGTRYRANRKVIVVSVARIKFCVVDAENYVKYQESYRDGVFTYWNIQTWRKDTGQEDGSGGYNSPTIYTAETWALKLRMDKASEYLKTVGIETYRLKTNIVDTLTLANLIRKHNGEEEI